MLRSALLMIGHVLTVDFIGLVQKMVGGIQKLTGSYSRRSLPFSSLSRFSPSPLPLPFLCLPRRLVKIEPQEIFTSQVTVCYISAHFVLRLICFNSSFVSFKYYF